LCLIAVAFRSVPVQITRRRLTAIRQRAILEKIVMHRRLLVTGLLLLALGPVLANEDPPADEGKQKTDALRTYYGKMAGKYEFFRDAERKQPLKLAEKPVMKWANDDDWSGDLFVWMWDERPEVIGCILTGPQENNRRIAFQEFHLLAAEPIAPADMQGRVRWAPKDGLKRIPLDGVAEPAETPVARLTQMRQILRDFSAHMEANGEWELRLLPQPLLRYQPKEGPVIDGALFTFVWTKGTDPELVLLLECRKTKDGTAWFYAPVRFSNRAVWLKHHEIEVWRGPSHQEPAAESDLLYTTHYLDTIDDPRTETR
jgi:hypothetical protein